MKELFDHAMKDFGLAELPGEKSHPRIRQAIREAAEWLNPDDSKTAWCGCIMGLWFKEVGLEVPAEYFRAASWATVGKEVPLSEAEEGDVIVMKRPGGNHVCLFAKDKGKMIRVLGGNQSNQVNFSEYNKGLVTHVRRVKKEKTKCSCE